MKTLRELIAGATPGPWMHLSGERIVFTKLNDGCRGAPVVTAEYAYLPQAQENLVLIARCNPQTMEAVLEALEAAQHEIAADYIGRSFENNPAWNKVTDALSLLNSTPSANPSAGKQ